MSGQVKQLSTMKRRPSQPSRRLLAAAEAERAGIERERQQLVAHRRTLRAQIDDLDAQLAELAERTLLIDRLSAASTGNQDPPAAVAERSASPDKTVLRGPAIRQTAVKTLRADPRHPQALHYRDWFALLDQSGYSVAGKDPLAVFLTQLSRSPVVRRGTQSGVYELDLDAVERLRHQLAQRQHHLWTLTSAASSTTDLSGIRTQRTALTQEIDKLEKALEEAEMTLDRDPSSLAAAS
jgi:septal ring factor EnvC (AmiA/AmiB activator)